MQRRDFIKNALTLALAPLALAHAADGAAASTQRYNGPILDCHAHLFDPRRPQGVPWPAPGDPMYGVSLPDGLQQLLAPFGTVGAIAVEASDWRNDNFWLLDTVRQSPFMVGFVGDLLPGTVDFASDLEWLSAEPLFLGLRYGNLWHRDLSEALQKPAFIADLRRLQSRGRVLETANPDPTLIRSSLTLSDRIPELNIVLDHLPNATVPKGQERQFEQDLIELGKHRTVSFKLSEIPQKDGAQYRFDVGYYQHHLDRLWDIFGADRILFGGDYPNSKLVGTIDQVYGLVRAYLDTKPVADQAKVLYGNSKRVYRWQPRTAQQS